MDKNFTQLIVVEPASPALHSALDALKKQSSSLRMEIVSAPNYEVATRLVNAAAISLVVMSIRDLANVAPAIVFAKSLASYIEGKFCKVVAVNSISTDRLTKALEQLKLSFVVSEPVAPRTLMFKLILQIKALETFRKELALQEKRNELVEIKSDVEDPAADGAIRVSRKKGSKAEEKFVVNAVETASEPGDRHVGAEDEPHKRLAQKLAHETSAAPANMAGVKIGAGKTAVKSTAKSELPPGDPATAPGVDSVRIKPAPPAPMNNEEIAAHAKQFEDEEKRRRAEKLGGISPVDPGQKNQATGSAANPGNISPLKSRAATEAPPLGLERRAVAAAKEAEGGADPGRAGKEAAPEASKGRDEIAGSAEKVERERRAENPLSVKERERAQRERRDMTERERPARPAGDRPVDEGKSTAEEPGTTARESTERAERKMPSPAGSVEKESKARPTRAIAPEKAKTRSPEATDPGEKPTVKAADREALAEAGLRRAQEKIHAEDVRRDAHGERVKREREEALRKLAGQLANNSGDPEAENRAFPRKKGTEAEEARESIMRKIRSPKLTALEPGVRARPGGDDEDSGGPDEGRGAGEEAGDADGGRKARREKFPDAPADFGDLHLGDEVAENTASDFAALGRGERGRLIGNKVGDLEDPEVKWEAKNDPAYVPDEVGRPDQTIFRYKKIALTPDAGAWVQVGPYFIYLKQSVEEGIPALLSAIAVTFYEGSTRPRSKGDCWWFYGRDVEVAYEVARLPEVIRTFLEKFVVKAPASAAESARAEATEGAAAAGPGALAAKAARAVASAVEIAAGAKAKAADIDLPANEAKRKGAVAESATPGKKLSKPLADLKETLANLKKRLEEPLSAEETVVPTDAAQEKTEVQEGLEAGRSARKADASGSEALPGREPKVEQPEREPGPAEKGRGQADASVASAAAAKKLGPSVSPEAETPRARDAMESSAKGSPSSLGSVSAEGREPSAAGTASPSTLNSSAALPLSPRSGESSRSAAPAPPGSRSRLGESDVDRDARTSHRAAELPPGVGSSPGSASVALAPFDRLRARGPGSSASLSDLERAWQELAAPPVATIFPAGSAAGARANLAAALAGAVVSADAFVGRRRTVAEQMAMKLALVESTHDYQKLLKGLRLIANHVQNECASLRVEVFAAFPDGRLESLAEKDLSLSLASVLGNASHYWCSLGYRPRRKTLALLAFPAEGERPIAQCELDTLARVTTLFRESLTAA